MAGGRRMSWRHLSFPTEKLRSLQVCYGEEVKLVPRGLVNAANLCYMHCVSSSVFVCEGRTVLVCFVCTCHQYQCVFHTICLQAVFYCLCDQLCLQHLLPAAHCSRSRQDSLDQAAQILQMLLACPPLVNLLRSLNPDTPPSTDPSPTPMLDCM